MSMCQYLWAYTLEQEKKPCLVRSWQHTIRVFTPAMCCAESERLKEERIRGIREGEKRAEFASQDLEREGQSDHSDLQGIMLLGVLEVFLLR